MESNPLFLKKSSEFNSLKEGGQRFWVTKWLLFNYAPSSDSDFRVGVTASRKVGPAVVRNKLKRWTREYFRSFSKTNQSLHVHINIIFKPIDQGFYKGLSYEEYSRALDRGLRQIEKNK